MSFWYDGQDKGDDIDVVKVSFIFLFDTVKYVLICVTTYLVLILICYNSTVFLCT